MSELIHRNSIVYLWLEREKGLIGTQMKLLGSQNMGLLYHMIGSGDILSCGYKAGQLGDKKNGDLKAWGGIKS